jgi:hypothetical protein
VARKDSPGDGDLASFEVEILPVLERLVAALLPLIEHRSAFFGEQLKEITRIGNTTYVQNGYADWNALASWAAWWIGHATAAFALSVENYEGAALVFRIPVQQVRGTKSLLTMLTADAVRALMESVYSFNGKAPEGYQFTHLAQRLGSSQFLNKRYPEFVKDSGVGAAKWLSDLNFLASFWAAECEEPIIGYWTLRHGAAHAFARRLRDDDAFREQLAREVFMMDLATFDRRLPVWLERLYAGSSPLLLMPDRYSHSEAMEILTGKDEVRLGPPVCDAGFRVSKVEVEFPRIEPTYLYGLDDPVPPDFLKSHQASVTG